MKKLYIFTPMVSLLTIFLLGLAGAASAAPITFQIDGRVVSGGNDVGALSGSYTFDSAATGSPGLCGQPLLGDAPCTVYAALEMILNVEVGVHTYTSTTLGTIGVVDGAFSDRYWIFEDDAGGTIPWIFPNPGNPRFSIQFYDGTKTMFGSDALPTSPDFQAVSGFGNGLIRYDCCSGGAGSVSFEDVQLTTVPVPAAFYLFGSGLLGLVGMARRKKAA